MCKLTDENLQKISRNTIQEYPVEDSLVKWESFLNYTKIFKVTITKKLQKIVTVEAADQQEAEQIVFDNRKNGEYILDADDFVGVEFTTCENYED